MIDDSGWIHTGDIARIEDGRVFVQGRLKDIIVLSTGEKVAASNVEAAIAEDPLIDQICVVGESRPCLAAVVVPERKQWLEFAAEEDFDPDDADDDAATRALLARFRARSAHLPKPSQVRAVLIARRPWTAANGILTPTLKVKRLAIEQRYATQIDSLFAALESRHLTARVSAD